MAHREQVYGTFMGGDPRNFAPDEDDNSPEEIARWKAACADFEAGNIRELAPGCFTFGDGSAWSGEGFGMGITTIEGCTCDEPPGNCSHGVPMTGDYECAECRAFMDAVFNHPSMYGRQFA